MNLENLISFNNPLFTDQCKEKIKEKIIGSNILSNKLVNDITKIDFNLTKNSNHNFTLSATTKYINKDIHIDENGDDVYLLIPLIVGKLERSIRKQKEKQ